MKRIYILLIIFCLFLTSCSDGKSDNVIYREYMKDFVNEISSWAKGISSNFIIIPQNGHDLLAKNYDPNDGPALSYISAIDGIGREDLLYGYTNNNIPTPVKSTKEMTSYLDLLINQGKIVLATDYCWTHSYMDDSYAQNLEKGYISFAADSRELDTIPTYPATPYNVNTNNIVSLSDAANFLYLLNTENYASKTAFLNALGATDYDLFIIDAFYGGTNAFTLAEVNSLKTKASSGSRLVIVYMSIGEAEDYRYYWNPSWNTSPPDWLAEENPEWQGNYKVCFWMDEWKSIIFGKADSYLQRIIDAGFDGVYLDIIDAFEYWEEQ